MRSCFQLARATSSVGKNLESRTAHELRHGHERAAPSGVEERARRVAIHKHRVGERQKSGRGRKHHRQARAYARSVGATRRRRHPKELGHPRPREAVTFALTVVGLTLQGLVVQDERGGKLDDDSLIEELTRMVTGYLTLRA